MQARGKLLQMQVREGERIEERNGKRMRDFKTVKSMGGEMGEER